MSPPTDPVLPNRRTRIETILNERFAPSRLVVDDDSARHVGHAGDRGGETHYNVLLVSEVFAGQGRLQRSRTVHEALDNEFRTGLHALSLSLRTPAETAST